MKKIITKGKSGRDFPTEYRTYTTGLGQVFWKLNLRESENIPMSKPKACFFLSHRTGRQVSFKR